MTNDELRRLAGAATPGPWYPHTDCYGRSDAESTNWMAISRDADAPHNGRILSAELSISTEEQDAANFIFIAAARQAVPALLDEVDALRAALRNTVVMAPFWPACSYCMFILEGQGYAAHEHAADCPVTRARVLLGGEQ